MESEQIDQEGLLEVIVQVQQEMRLRAAQPSLSLMVIQLTREGSWNSAVSAVGFGELVDQEMAAAQAEQSAAAMNSSSGSA